MIEQDDLDREAYRDGRLHRVHATDAMLGLSVSSKMNAEMDFLSHLFDIGRATAEDWVQTTWPDVGRTSTWRPREIFEESVKPAHLAPGTARRTSK